MRSFAKITDLRVLDNRNFFLIKMIIIDFILQLFPFCVFYDRLIQEIIQNGNGRRYTKQLVLLRTTTAKYGGRICG